MKNKLILIFALIAYAGLTRVHAQEHHGVTPMFPAEASADTTNIKSIKELFTKGEVHGHVRNYFMSTWNHRQLSDNYADAIGAELGYRTAAFHGFRFGFAGLFTYSLFSSGIAERDPITNSYPKLEQELFDIHDPHNREDLDRLDELYLEYSSRRLLAKIGRFTFSSPLMNPQDTRMKPYSFQGVKLQLPVLEKGLLTLAWFDHFSPRSTVEWMDAAESIGAYQAGVDATGNPSAYPEHVSTKGVGIGGLQLRGGKHLQLEAWNYWIENISNTSYGRAVLEMFPGVKAGAEGLYQFQAGNGGHAVEDFAYFPDQQQWLIGGLLGYEPQHWQLSMNFLHMGGAGRFLFPREWGREQFFATLPRGRMEGTGAADLLVAKVHRQWKGKFSSELALARAWLPAGTDYRHNKYGAHSYWGWVADIKYQPVKPVMDGLSFRLLYIGRVSPQEGISLQEMYYNTNFHNLNFITQLTF